MTLGKVTLLTFGFIGAVALGVGISPYLMDRADGRDVAPTAIADPAASPPAGAPAPVARPTVTRPLTRPAPSIPVSSPELHARMKPLLNKGADVTIASEDFRSAEQFAAVAHAARNTDVPFMVLKHRVVTEGKSLATAIKESRPDIDAAVEANRALAEARSDLASLEG
jgi:hypothetical protein